MNTFLKALLIGNLICVGIWTCFGTGMILGWLGDIWERRLPNAINKPLWMCPPCMASVHGSWVCWMFIGDINVWIPFCLALCGLNKIVTVNFLRE